MLMLRQRVGEEELEPGLSSIRKSQDKTRRRDCSPALEVGCDGIEGWP